MFNGVKTRKNELWSRDLRKCDWFQDSDYIDMVTKSRRTELRLLPRSEARRWSEIPRDILVEIFRRVPYFFLLNISGVSRSWRSSVLSTVFPLAEVLDLTILDSLPMYLHNIYLFLVKILLDTRPQTQRKRLIFPAKVELKGHAICYILERSEIYSIIHQLGTHCKNISRLSITSRIGAETAYAIVECLPEIKYLNLGMSTITIKALLLLDGLKNLDTLDLEHSLCVERAKLGTFHHDVLASVYTHCCNQTIAKLWEKEICAMVSGNKNYGRCQQNQCPKCSWEYQLAGRINNYDGFWH